jgi:hypothetical protein
MTVLLLVSTSASICGCSNGPPSDSVLVGQSKDDVRKILGDPQAIETSIKRNEVIWGPEEEFWDDIPEGSELETWSYELRDGNLNLYFINGSDKLGHKAFAPRGVVYESSCVPGLREESLPMPFGVAFELRGDLGILLNHIDLLVGIRL